MDGSAVPCSVPHAQKFLLACVLHSIGPLPEGSLSNISVGVLRSHDFIGAALRSMAHAYFPTKFVVPRAEPSRRQGNAMFYIHSPVFWNPTQAGLAPRYVLSKSTSRQIARTNREAKFGMLVARPWSYAHWALELCTNRQGGLAWA